MSQRDNSGQQPDVAPWQRELVVDARSRRRRSRGPSVPQPGPRRRRPHPVFVGAPWAGVTALTCGAFAAATQILPSSLDLSTASTTAAVVAMVLGVYAVIGGLMGSGRTDIAGAALLLAALSIVVGIWFHRPTPLRTPT